MIKIFRLITVKLIEQYVGVYHVVIYVSLAACEKDNDPSAAWFTSLIL